MRYVRNDDLVGKTISRVNSEAVNVLELHFTDGTTIKLLAEDAVNTEYGSIPGIFMED